MSLNDLDGLRSGDRFITGKIYDEHYSLIERMIVSQRGDSDDAKDIYQEAFLIFLDNIQNPNFELTVKISTYLYAIAKNLWFKRLRVLGQQSFIIDERFADELPDVSENVDRFLEEEQKYDNLYLGLEQLGEPCKSVLTDFFFQKLSMEAIAIKHGYTNSDNAKTQKYKCLMRLKKLVAVGQKRRNE
jgi:RNA polymerase sigma factor (sigma-70 family)